MAFPRASAQDLTLTVLVAYANTHASTAEIAQQIADRLRKSGFRGALRPVDRIDSLQPYRAVVIGSALHNQDWLPDAAEFLSKFAGELSTRPVWLFSSCPSDDTSSSLGTTEAAPIASERPESAAVVHARKAIRIRDHRQFVGDFERGGWESLGDLFSKVCGGLPADPRDFRDINEWASGIARELQAIDGKRERRRLHMSVRGRR